jgi:hypothetical protein
MLLSSLLVLLDRSECTYKLSTEFIIETFSSSQSLYILALLRKPYLSKRRLKFDALTTIA